MGSKIEYVDSSQIYATRYVRNSKAIGVLWAIFTICYAIICGVVLVTPEWIANASSNAVASSTTGRFGLWSICKPDDDGIEECHGKLEEFYDNYNYAFQGATVAVGLALIASLLAIVVMIAFFFCHSTTVYHICAWLQLVSGICMIIGCAVYPLGWDDESVKSVCEDSAQYDLGNCGVRWAYLLAAIACLDAIILSTLAFILATRHIRLQPDPQYAPASLFKGEMNGAFVNDAGSVAGSRKSLNLHPVLMMHPGQDDTYSQFSQRTVPRSTHSGHYGHPIHHY
jgi:hypothetical protein